MCFLWKYDTCLPLFGCLHEWKWSLSIYWKIFSPLHFELNKIDIKVFKEKHNAELQWATLNSNYDGALGVFLGGFHVNDENNLKLSCAMAMIYNLLAVAPWYACGRKGATFFTLDHLKSGFLQTRRNQKIVPEPNFMNLAPQMVKITVDNWKGVNF